MTATEIYQLARETGFPPETAVSMVAIALKESGGNPHAFNGKPPDRSYGLYQINMYGNLSAARMAEYGLSDETDLYDPAINTAAAYSLWSGDDANLDRHWAIGRGANKDRYEQFLPAAMEAAFQVEGVDVQPAASDSTWMYVAAAAAIAAVLFL